MKALYICDDKEQWGFIRNLFSSHFPKVELICVINGNDAFEYLSYEGPFALILIEAVLRDENPSTLARQFIEVAGERPMIFIGEKVHINDLIDQDLYAQNETNHILLKPMDIVAFKDKIKKSLEWAKHEEFEKSIEEIDKEELLPMKLRNFYMFDTLPYDVYLELTSTKYVKIISAEKKYTHSEINVYAKKNVRYLYLRKNEYLKFLEDGIEKLLAIFESSQRLTSKKIIANQIRAVLLIHQYVQTVGVSAKLIKLCDIVIESSRPVILEHKKFRTILEQFPDEKTDIAEQSVITLYLAECILFALGWGSETSRKKLGLASLLYDSMLKNDDLTKINSLDDPQLLMFTETEQLDYKNHPLKAAEVATQFTGYPEADFIIAQHHERPKGDGFPNKLSTNRLTAHSCTFIIANTFTSKFVYANKEPGALLNIFREIKNAYNQGNFKEPIDALQRTII